MSEEKKMKERGERNKSLSGIVIQNAKCEGGTKGVKCIWYMEWKVNFSLEEFVTPPAPRSVQ